MRIHAASASTAVTRTLEEIILISGHTPSPAETAELALVDETHPRMPTLTCPRITLGGNGAEGDSLAAPFAPRQLIRLLRSRNAAQPTPLNHGWQVDATARTLLHASGTRATLTEKECALLLSLLDAFPESVRHDTLLAEVWGLRHEIDTHTLETHIYRLRSKLDGLAPRPCDIVTVGGAYKLTMEEA